MAKDNAYCHVLIYLLVNLTLTADLIWFFFFIHIILSIGMVDNMLNCSQWHTDMLYEQMET